MTATTVGGFTVRPVEPSLVAAAEAAAATAAAAAGVSIREVDDVTGFEATRRLFDAIWQPELGDEPVSRGILNALVHCGNYCSAAFDQSMMVGASVGFLGMHPEPLLHSHITGVLPETAGRGVGRAMKLHQRWWALRHGIRVITWTYDPLVRRNAYFNATTLGARPVEYLVDFYGEMKDSINAGQGSDRLLTRWDLLTPHLGARPGQEPAPFAVQGSAVDALIDVGGAPHVRLEVAQLIGAGVSRLAAVQVPADIEAIRTGAPAVAGDWRHAVRALLGGLMDAGWRVLDVAKDGRYVLQRPDGYLAQATHPAPTTIRGNG